MSIQRIFSPACGSYGYQARAHVRKGHPRLTRFFSEVTHGIWGAHRLAEEAEAKLKRKAARIRKSLS